MIEARNLTMHFGCGRAADLLLAAAAYLLQRRDA